MFLLFFFLFLFFFFTCLQVFSVLLHLQFLFPKVIWQWHQDLFCCLSTTYTGSNPPSQQTKTKNQKPKTKNQKPKTKNQKPKTKNQKPKTKNQKPKTKKKKGYLLGKFVTFIQDVFHLRVDELALFGRDLALGSMMDESHFITHSPLRYHTVC
jgi:hypothetical protein